MKNIEIINTVNAINEFVGSNKEIPVKVSYAITKNIKTLMGAIEPYEIERNRISKEYEEKLKEDGADKNVLAQEKEAAIRELLDIDIEVSIHKIQLSTLENCEHLTTKDILALEFMIEAE